LKRGETVVLQVVDQVVQIPAEEIAL
jgi:hypothetical protein